MIVLDTHAWVWHAASPAKLSKAAQREIGRAERLGVSAISCWEIATLARRGRLELDRDVDAWLALATRLPGLTVIPVDGEIAALAGSFGDAFHGDPADRLIAATAARLRASLVTKDARIATAGIVPCIW